MNVHPANCHGARGLVPNIIPRALIASSICLIAGLVAAAPEKTESAPVRRAGSDHWSLQPVVPAQLPEVKNKTWPRTAGRTVQRVA